MANVETAPVASSASGSGNAAPVGEFLELPPKQYANIALVSLALGALFDFLFYGVPAGVSYPLFIVALYLGFFLVARGEARLRLDHATFLFIPILGSSLAFLLFSNPLLAVINRILVPVLIFIQFMLVLSRNRFHWFDVRFVEDFLDEKLVLAARHLFTPFARLRSGATPAPAALSHLKRALLGVLIGLPLLMLVVSLLASADNVFSKYAMDTIDNFFSDFREVFMHASLIVTATAIASGTACALLMSRAHTTRPEYPAPARFFDPVGAAGFLASLNLVYILFAVVQFAYLFGGGRSMQQGFLTYSEYARHGFIELLAVTVINLGAMLVVERLTRLDGRGATLAVRLLLSLLIACTSVILYSAHFRLSLYEEAYGYTYARLYAHTIMILLGLLFAYSLYKVWVDRASFVKGFVLLSLLAYVWLNFADVDAIIARENRSRYAKTGRLDVDYLLNLSYSAVPVYAPLCNEGNQDERVRGAVCNHLQELLAESRDSARSDWRSFNVSRHAAFLASSRDYRR